MGRDTPYSQDAVINLFFNDGGKVKQSWKSRCRKNIEDKTLEIYSVMKVKP